MSGNVSYELIDNTPHAWMYLEQLEEQFYTKYVNKSFEKMFHISLAEIERMTLAEILNDMSLQKEGINQISSIVEKTGKTYKENLYSYKYNNYYYVNIFRVQKNTICITFTDVSDYANSKEKMESLYKQVAASDEELRFQVNLLIGAREKLARNEAMYKLISEASSDGFVYNNYETGVSETSVQCKELFGLDEIDSDNQQIFNNLIFEPDRMAYLKYMSEVYEKKSDIFEVEFRINNGKIWIKNTGKISYNFQGECVEKVSFFKDITESKERHLTFEKMAYYDMETDMYNRQHFLVTLDEALMKAKEQSNLVQVMTLDVDDFKKINDSIGFLLGDELIYSFANILKEYETESIKCGRFSNDEFAIALYDAHNENSSEILYSQIKNRLDRPIVLSNGLEVFLNISVGISKFPEGGKSAIDLIKSADIAMYYVKEHGKNGMINYEYSMMNKFLNNVMLEQRLKMAVDNNELFLLYQPQYHCYSSTLRGVEALVRWKDKKNGIVSPSIFIPMAERMGYIVKIGEWVIDEALKTAADWKNHYNFDGIMSINISAIQLHDKKLIDYILMKTKQYGLKPGNIELEITESVFIDDNDDVIQRLLILNGYGYKISLDDFGTGYSSLSYLKDIPIDTLKIDKSFVDSMIVDDATQIITSSVIEMVKKLGFETIAEGVETKEQFEYLEAVKCDNIQGFLLGRPMYDSKIIEILQNRQTATLHTQQ